MVGVRRTFLLFLPLLGSHQAVAEILLLLVEARSPVRRDVGEGRTTSWALRSNGGGKRPRADSGRTLGGEGTAHAGTRTTCEHGDGGGRRDLWGYNWL